MAVVVSCEQLFYKTVHVKLPESIGTDLIFDQGEEELVSSYSDGEFYIENAQAGQNITVRTSSHYAVEDQEGNIFAFMVSESITDLSDRDLQVMKRLFIKKFCITNAHGSSISGVNVRVSQGQTTLFDFKSVDSCLENESPSIAEFDASKAYSITIIDPRALYLPMSYTVYENQLNVLQFTSRLQTVKPKRMDFSFYDAETLTLVSNLSVKLLRKSGDSWQTFSTGSTNESGVFALSSSSLPEGDTFQLVARDENKQHYAESITTFVFYANTTLGIPLSLIKSYHIKCFDHNTL